MHIALASISFYPSYGGIATSLYYMAQYLKRLGHEPIIFVGRHANRLGSYDEIDGISVFRYTYPLSKWGSLFRPSLHFASAYRSWRRVCERGTVDAVWSHYAPVGYAVHKAGFDGPIIYTFHVLMNSFLHERVVKLKKGSLQSRIRHLLYMINYSQNAYFERGVVRNARGVVTFSDNIAAQVVHHYPSVRGKITTVSPGVDAGRFSPKKSYPELAQSYGLGENQKVFLYVGRLSAEKNLEHLIEAFSLVEGKDNVLLLVGEGKHRHFLEGRCRELGIEDRVVFTGYQDDPSPFYALAYFFVLPTLYEGFGLVYLEALSSGVPCIGYAGDLTATVEIIQDGINGFVVYESSPVALSQAMTRACNLKKSEHQKMSQNARNIAVENYSWEQFVREVLSLSFD